MDLFNPADGGTGLAARRAIVLSQEILSGNLDALTRAQGMCPALGRLRDSMRVALSGEHLNVEARTSAGDWQAIDTPESADGEHWLDALVTGASQAILVGVGLGYALDRAQRLGLQKVVVVEPDPGVATLFLSRRDWREWFTTGRLRLLTGPDYRGATDTARLLDGLKDIPIVTHPQRTMIEPEISARATAVAERVAANARSNGRARHRFAGPYLLQTLTNLPAIAREGDVRTLGQAFTNVPAVIVGAGPSLDENIPELRALSDRAIVIAADTALGPLVSGGVRPHLVVAADSSELNARHLTAPADSGGVMLVAEGSVHPTVVERFSGRLFSFRVADHEPWPWLRTAGVDRGPLRAWGSVLTCAFDLACRMGCDPIVFAGADLAFTGMRPYCRGTIYDAQWQEWIDKGCTWEQLMEEYFSRQPEVYRDDIRGERTRTASNLVSYRDWLIEQINALQSQTVINATGGGILHGGAIRQASLRDVLAGMPAVSGVRETLRVKRTAASARRANLPRLSALLQDARVSRSLPLQRWIDFTAATISERDILSALPDSV